MSVMNIVGMLILVIFTILLGDLRADRDETSESDSRQDKTNREVFVGSVVLTIIAVTLGIYRVAVTTFLYRHYKVSAKTGKGSVSDTIR